MAYKFCLYWLQQLTSLDTLDASLASRTSSVPDAKPRWSSNAKKPLLARRWSTQLICFYAISVLATLCMMVKTAVDFSKESHPNYSKFSGLLESGWISSQRLDTSDFQYANFRKHLVKFGVLSISHPFGRWIYDLTFPSAGAKHINCQTLKNVRMQRRTQFDVIFGLLFLSILHGIAAANLLFVMIANYGIVKTFPRRYIPTATWIFNIGLLFARNIPTANTSIKEGVALWMSRHSFMQWCINFVRFEGLMPRWEILIKASVLRMISFNMDYYWSMGTDTPYKEKENMTYPVQISETKYIQISEKSIYSVRNYVAYMLYSPLYIAGPVLTFDGYIVQQFHVQPSTSWIRTTLYGVRLLFAILCMEIMLHYIYVNAILKASPEWLIYTPFEISMLAYFKLKFTWLKLLIIWRFSRFWALMDGIDPPENLLRCMTNNFSVLGFWRGWHRSFNRWVIRYIYLPAGGGTLNISRRSSTSLGHHTFRVHARQVGILFVVFTFSAIWHEINLRLLLWGWLITIFLLPETILVRWASVKNWPSQHAALHFLVSVGGATNIITMIFANLVGFSGQGSDLKGLIYQVMSSWSGWSFLLRAILICSVGVQVMLKIRNEESRRGIYLRC